MEPVAPAVELVDAGRAGREARDDAIVTTAFAAHHEEPYAFLVRATHQPDVAGRSPGSPGGSRVDERDWSASALGHSGGGS